MDMYRVDPVSLAESYGIEVSATPLLDVDGKIEKVSDDKYKITYNSSTHKNRQRFTVAHELGHFLLKHLDDSNKMLRDPRKNFSSENYDLKEVEANKMAASILMPQETLEHLIYDLGHTDLDELATILGVSTVALHYRLKNLGMVWAIYPVLN